MSKRKHLKPADWKNAGRNEITCPHGVGHGPHIHGCDGCCSDPSFAEAFKRLKGRGI